MNIAVIPKKSAHIRLVFLFTVVCLNRSHYRKVRHYRRGASETNL